MKIKLGKLTLFCTVLRPQYSISNHRSVCSITIGYETEKYNQLLEEQRRLLLLENLKSKQRC